MSCSMSTLSFPHTQRWLTVCCSQFPGHVHFCHFPNEILMLHHLSSQWPPISSLGSGSRPDASHRPVIEPTIHDTSNYQLSAHLTVLPTSSIPYTDQIDQSLKRYSCVVPWVLVPDAYSDRKMSSLRTYTGPFDTLRKIVQEEGGIWGLQLLDAQAGTGRRVRSAV